MLTTHPNKQNSRYWSVTNPYRYEDCVKQGGQKVMCWAGIINGRILPIHWFEPGVSFNGEIYHGLLKDKLWPEVRSLAAPKAILFINRMALHVIVQSTIWIFWNKSSQIE